MRKSLNITFLLNCKSEYAAVGIPSERRITSLTHELFVSRELNHVIK
jgi:hypothetical protein